MNWTSAAEVGGKVARVEDGNVLVDWPGAPGWTTTGVAGADCCAETERENKHAREMAANSSFRGRATLFADLSVSVALKGTNVIMLDGQSVKGFHLTNKARNRENEISDADGIWKTFPEATEYELKRFRIRVH